MKYDFNKSLKKHKQLYILGLICIIIIISAALIIKNNISTKEEYKLASINSNDELSFAVLGDVHDNISNFETAIDDIYKINNNMDALILNGDNVDQGLDYQYDEMKEVLDKNKDKLPENIIKNIGNHEFYNYDEGTNSKEDVQECINKYLDFSGNEKVYHDNWIKGYHFISLGTEDQNSDTADSIQAYISDEQVNWLSEKLGENYEKGKPIFVFLHQPFLMNFWGKSYSGVDESNSENIINILSEYPEVVLFTSHSHKDLKDENVNNEYPFTMVHTGAVGYTIVHDDVSGSLNQEYSYINGLYVQVNGNDVKVNGLDLKDKTVTFSEDISKSE